MCLYATPLVKKLANVLLPITVQNAECFLVTFHHKTIRCTCKFVILIVEDLATHAHTIPCERLCTILSASGLVICTTVYKMFN